MPFTPTHVVAAVPLARLRLPPRLGGAPLPFSALALGSMTPDLPSFVALWRGAHFLAHSLLGVLTLDLALGLVAYALWQALIKRPAVELLPAPARERLGAAAAPVALGDPRQWALAALGVALGALTHVVWDAFTHAGRWGVELLPFLEVELLRIGGRGIPGYRALQYGSSVVGLPLLALLALRWLARRPRAPRPSPLSAGARAATWGALLGAPAAVGVAAAVYQPSRRHGVRRLMGYAYEAATWGGQALIVGVLVGGVLWSLWLARASAPEPD